MWVDGRHTDPKCSLILAGGGMRVAYQAGVLLALEEAGIEFSHVDGTSGGIFNAAMLASGLEPKEITERWRSLKIKDFISGRKFRDYLKPFTMTGYADADNIRNKVFPHLGIDLPNIRKNHTLDASFNVCNFSDKTVEAVSNKEVLEDHLIAGVSLPLMMPALQIGQDWYTDAVWIKDANLMEAVRQGSEELWLVWAIGNAPTYYPGAFNQYVHMIEMSANGALLEEFQQIDLINQMIHKGVDNLPQKQPIRLFVIKPPEPLPLDPDLFFNRVNTRELINMGYEHAKSRLSARPVLPTAMDSQATKNTNPGTVLSFRATFDGRLDFDNSGTAVTYYTYFRFNSLDSHSQLSFYSSIFLSPEHQEMITYQPSIHSVKSKNRWQLSVTSKLLIQGEEHSLTADFSLYSDVDFLLGLEMKRCRLSISNKKGLRLEGHLHQSLSRRLKACFFAQTSSGGKNGGLKKRFKMVKKLMEYEV